MRNGFQIKALIKEKAPSTCLSSYFSTMGHGGEYDKGGIELTRLKATGMFHELLVQFGTA